MASNNKFDEKLLESIKHIKKKAVRKGWSEERTQQRITKRKKKLELYYRWRRIVEKRLRQQFVKKCSDVREALIKFKKKKRKEARRLRKKLKKKLKEARRKEAKKAKRRRECPHCGMVLACMQNLNKHLEKLVCRKELRDRPLKLNEPDPTTSSGETTEEKPEIIETFIEYRPQILIDIELFFKETKKVNISDAVEGEGRGGSLKDEGAVKQVLKNSRFAKYVESVPARGLGDMIILDYDMKTKHVVDIKTTLGGGGCDNCFSRRGMVYALTSLVEVGKSLTYAKMATLIKTNKVHDPYKDYWILCINKKDSSDVLIRGLKQINYWTINANPSNILQVNWKKEKKATPKSRTWQEAYNQLIVNGFLESKRRDFELLRTSGLGESFDGI